MRSSCCVNISVSLHLRWKLDGPKNATDRKCSLHNQYL